MFELAFDLRWAAVFVRAIKICFAFRTYQRAFAFRAMIYIYYRQTSRHPFRNIYAGYFGNNFSAFFYKNSIVKVKVEALNFVGIMQGSAFYRSSSQLNRL